MIGTFSNYDIPKKVYSFGSIRIGLEYQIFAADEEKFAEIQIGNF